jgi:AAA family ATP:ADP antiporter
VTPRTAKGPLDRILGVFTEVRGGEGVTSLLLMLNMFLLLAAYYLLKTIREPLILNVHGGAEVKSYSAAATAGLLIILVPLYSAVAARVSRVKLINGVTLFFIACLVAFFGLSEAGVPIGVPFFIWVGIFSLMTIAQLWAFATDVYTVDQGKRLFAIVGFGASLGAIVGSFATGQLVKDYGPYPFMLGAAALLVVSMVLTNVVNLRERRRRATTPPAAPAAGSAPDGEAAKDAGGDEPVRGRSGFALVFADRYLLLIAGLMLVYNLVNCSKPVVAAVRGSAVGAGLAIALLTGLGSGARTASPKAPAEPPAALTPDQQVAELVYRVCNAAFFNRLTEAVGLRLEEDNPREKERSR